MPPSNARDPGELDAIKTVFETGALLAVHKKDSRGFENSVALLKNLYNDYGLKPNLDILSLYLTYFISYNEFIKFHSELEQLPFADRAYPGVKYAIELEQFISEGNY